MSLLLSGSLFECVHCEAQTRTCRNSPNASLYPRGVATARPLRGLDEWRETSRVICCSGQATATVLPSSDEDNVFGVVRWKGDQVNREEWIQFQELCSGALEMLELLLQSRSGCPETYGTGELRFELADNMDLVGGDSNTEVNSTLLLGNADAESFLARNEYLDLPHKSCSVFPLTRGLHVVGLLLMLLDEESPHNCGSSSTVQSLGKGESPIKNFIEKDGDVLQSVKKTLASACDLYQSAVLLKAASSAKSKFASGLLMETKGPVKVVRSMANMLHYRVGAEDPEMDMVQNIQDQGARLSEVVGQLEAALNTPSHSQIAPCILQGCAGNIEADSRPKLGLDRAHDSV